MRIVTEWIHSAHLKEFIRTKLINPKRYVEGFIVHKYEARYDTWKILERTEDMIKLELRLCLLDKEDLCI